MSYVLLKLTQFDFQWISVTLKNGSRSNLTNLLPKAWSYYGKLLSQSPKYKIANYEFLQLNPVIT